MSTHNLEVNYGTFDVFVRQGHADIAKITIGNGEDLRLKLAASGVQGHYELAALLRNGSRIEVPCYAVNEKATYIFETAFFSLEDGDELFIRIRGLSVQHNLIYGSQVSKERDQDDSAPLFTADIYSFPTTAKKGT
jgi:hypothetical protein